VPSFKPAEWRNAPITLSWMIGLLIGMFGGVLSRSSSSFHHDGRSWALILERSAYQLPGCRPRVAGLSAPVIRPRR
jgi:hypothetical protein